jgi:transglutaminase-like putative cysteine protease
MLQILISRWPKSFAWFLAAACAVVFSGAVLTPAWAIDDEDHHFRIDNLHVKIHVNADGSSITDWYEVTDLLTETGIDWYGEESVTFSTTRENLEIVDAYTEHPDGQQFKLDDKAIRLVEADSAGDSTYSDGKSYVLIFPNLKPGVKTHYRTRTVEHTPLHRGHYFQTFWFSVGIYYADVSIELSHDPAIDLQIEVSDAASNQVPKITYERLPQSKDGRVRYRFHYANPDPIQIDDATVSRMDISPYIRISSIPSMLEEAKLYQAAATDQEQPTERIRELADEITAGITDPKEQARALYNWVATQIRYVGIYLGDGGIVPNHADDILRNLYGDCKDKSTLLVALLAAKGIEAESAMVNSGDAFTLPKLGDISPINHVITYLPTWDLYVDSTNRYAAFGELSYSISDKPTVLGKSERYHRTPKSSSTRNRTTTNVNMEIAADGQISGTSTVSATGSSAPRMRSYLMDYSGPKKGEMPVSQLAAYNQVGTGTYEFEPMGELNNPVVLETTFSVNPVTNFPGPGGIWMPVGLGSGRINDMRSEPPMLPQSFPFVCRSYAYEEHYSLAFPDNVRINYLPKSIEFSENGHRYSATYSLEGNVVRLSRLLEIERASDVCQSADEEAYNKLLTVVQADLRGQILYEPKRGM